MVHEGQRLTLGLEARDDLPGIHPRLNDFDGDLPPDRLLLLGQENYAAASLAELLDEPEAANPIAGFFSEGTLRSGSFLMLGKPIRRFQSELQDAARAVSCRRIR
jgi:hypothetical protein